MNTKDLIKFEINTNVGTAAAGASTSVSGAIFGYLAAITT